MLPVSVSSVAVECIRLRFVFGLVTASGAAVWAFSVSRSGVPDCFADWSLLVAFCFASGTSRSRSPDILFPLCSFSSSSSSLLSRDRFLVCCCLLAVSPSLVRLRPIPSLLPSRSPSLAMISCNTRPLLMRSVPDIDVHVPLPVPVHPPIRPSLVVLTLEFNLYCVDLVAPHPRYRLRTTYDIQYTTTTRPPFAFAFVTCPVRLCVFNVLPSRLSFARTCPAICYLVFASRGCVRRLHS